MWRSKRKAGPSLDEATRKKPSNNAAGLVSESRLRRLELPSSNGTSGIKEMRSNPLGFNVVFNPDPSAVVADIVFVHGLGGTSHDTWYDSKSQVCWPVDFLHEDLGPICRIVMYGYDAKITKIFDGDHTPRLGITEHAKQLLGILGRRRHQTNSVGIRVVQASTRY